MKVVIAAYTFLPVVGGVSTTIAILARAFADAGNQVTVVTLCDGPTEGYGYEVIRRPGPLCLLRAYRNADVVILANLSVRMFYPLLFVRRSFALQHHSESAFKLGYSPSDLLRRVIRSRATHFVTSDYIGKKSGLGSYVVTRPYPEFREHQQRDHPAPSGPEACPVRWAGRAGKGHLVALREMVAGQQASWFGNAPRRRLRVCGRDHRTKCPGRAVVQYRAGRPFGPTRNGQGNGSRGFRFRSLTLAGAVWGGCAGSPGRWCDRHIERSRRNSKEAGASLALYYDPDDEAEFLAAVADAHALLLSILPILKPAQTTCLQSTSMSRCSGPQEVFTRSSTR